MDAALIVTTTTTILLAFIGYIITYINNVRTSQLDKQIERIGKQLGEFYGPLFAISQANNISWIAFRARYRPGEAFFGDGTEVSQEELEIWRLWMKTVFMPNNIQMYHIITTKLDLLIENEMPHCLLLLCAHVTSYQAVLKQWESNNFSEHTSLINYPSSELITYLQMSFQTLKQRQIQLLGMQKSRWSLFQKPKPRKTGK